MSHVEKSTIRWAETASRLAARVADVIDRLDMISMYLAAAGLVAMTAIVVAEVLLRLMFSMSTLVADEMASYFLAMVSFFALGYTLRTGGHLQVSLITDRLPAAIRKGLDIAATLVALVATFAFTSWLLRFVNRSYESKIDSQSQLETPLWIPQSALCIGAAVLFLALVSRLLRVLRHDIVP